ncbi:hypothetical protein PHLCEN_2v10406 [Hermanssonia centrifuga]|uniref:Carbamoyl phosphate synthase arginine-specific large chain n=1 Tax=Hermanssonia centrifuga TaxID=98765 RepID=A0A2R6NN03_9APHY|nr:hypothetical protein PHLCEN_2v10406 [Hermanssonia centrifuga]
MALDKPSSRILIVGAGVFGLSTAEHLLRRGFRCITILDRSEVLPAPDAASCDINKIVRSSYSDIFYSQLAREAIHLWKDESVWGDTYHESGVLVLRKSGNEAYTDQSYHNDIALGAHLEDLTTPDAIRATFPADIKTPSFEGSSGYLNHDGGWAFASQGVSLLMRRVASLGAQILAGKAVIELIKKDGKTNGVKCADGTAYYADLVVLASGSWTPSTFASLDLKGKCLATGQTVATIQLTVEEGDRYRHCPVVLDFGSGFYVFPPNADNVVKFAVHDNGFLHKPNSPDAPSTPRTSLSDGDDGLRIPKTVVKKLRDHLRMIYPELAEKPFSGTRLCWYNDSPDDDWVIGFHPLDPTLMLATAGSGHAYKVFEGLDVGDARMGLLRAAPSWTTRCLPSSRTVQSTRHFHWSPYRLALAPTKPVRAVARSAVGSYGSEEGEHVLNSPSELARKISAKVLPKIPRPDVSKVLIVGSGGLSIGQAGEFDYSGSQALKALREEGVDAVLINPNIATWQTSHELASEVYFLPITADYVAYVLEKERPDGVLLTFGGQSALNVGIELDRMGVLERLGVKVLGTPIRTLEVSEDRDLFVQALKEIDIPAAQSTAVSSVNDALAAAEKIGYPVILRSAFTLGGLGSGFANNADELRDLSAKSLSLSPQVLIERSMKGWKELEYEVVRDAADNTIICCNMENFDPLGTHTGDSIVVAPSQTLPDDEYHMLRSAALKVIRHLGVIGECNIQYALNPTSREYCVIEVNARLSRSSALASKATGYPLAYTAAKIALGHTLPELPNAVTKTTTACFEPSLDYIVTKIPKWDLAKFSSQVNREVGSAMKSVGEVMAIGRTFEESLQKAIRQVDPRWKGFEAYIQPEDLDRALSQPTDMRLFAIAYAMFNKNYTVDQLHDLTKIDKWFLYKIDNIVQTVYALKAAGSLEKVDSELMKRAKCMGFSDSHIADLISSSEDAVRTHRKSFGITPFVKRIDTLAAEYPAHTNYLYTTYNASEHDVEFDEHGTMVLGSGVYRIGSSVEFDWCAVTCARKLREMGKRTIMINYNPETVSTDFDEADRLYFEELGYERVMDIYELEQAQGVIVSVGGQLPQNIALRLKHNGVSVLGTDPEQIDNAEDRHKFSSILDSVGVDQPEWTEVTSLEAAKEFASRVSYPVLIRPSYVLSGAAMNVVFEESDLEYNLSAAASVSPLHPVVITKFIDNAQEIDVDAVAYKGKLLIHAISEHVEPAGVHSGDATLVLPPVSLGNEDMVRLKEIAEKVAAAFEISGPYNMQVIRKPAEDDKEAELKVIECNLRASRSFPFVSKVLGYNFIDYAAAAISGHNVPEPVDPMAEKRDYTAVKVAQFSWTRLGGADPFLGVEMASTGEVASFGKDIHEAYWAALLSTTGFKVPRLNSGVLMGGDITKPEMKTVAKGLIDLGFKLYCSSPVVEQFLNDIPYVSAKRIFFPTRDKRKLREVFDEYEIECVVNLAKSRGKDAVDEDYVARRNAVDFGLPLLNNARCAQLFVESLAKKIPQGGLRPYTEGRIPPEVRSWREFVGKRA